MKTILSALKVMCLVVAAATLAACYSQINITSPAKSRTNITTPFTLEVEHTGCGQPGPAITAWLDQGGKDERNISSSFDYEGGRWIAGDYALPEGTHTLWVQPQVQIGPQCSVLTAADSHQFIVHQATCVQATLFASLTAAAEAARPYTGAVVEIKLADSGESVATVKTDQNGFFCADRIPIGHRVDIEIRLERGSPVQIKNLDLGMNPHSCAQKDCPDVCKLSPDLCRGTCIVKMLGDD